MPHPFPLCESSCLGGLVRLSTGWVIARYIKVSEVTGKRGAHWTWQRAHVTKWKAVPACTLSAQISATCPKRPLKGHTHGAKLRARITGGDVPRVTFLRAEPDSALPAGKARSVRWNTRGMA